MIAPSPRAANPDDERRRVLVGAGVAVLGVAAATGAIYGLKQVAPVVSLSVVYLPAVLLVSAYWGLALGLATSILSAAAFNFFHIPPVGRFTISDSRNWVALAAFVIVAVVVSTIAELARTRAQEAERRRTEADLAAALARELLAGSQTSAALAGAARRLAQALAIPSATITLASVAGDARHQALELRDGAGTQIGTLLVPRRLTPETAERLRTQVVPALEAMVAIALRRDALQAESVETAALRRSDEVKTALLRAVSHDLRTPLTAIVAGGHALASASLSGEEREELSHAVVEQGQRLATLVDKLLDLSTLQAGRAQPRREWVSLEDVVLAAQESLSERGDAVRLALDPEVPAIRADAGQLERAVANLLENAPALFGRPAGARPRAPQRRARNRPHRRPRSGHPRFRARADLRAFLPRPHGRARDRERLGARAGNRQGLRRGQQRHHRSRVAARPGNELRHLAAARRRAAGEGAGMNAGGAPKVLVCDDEQQILRA
jgi:two-component system, OmpR family, sensor histidine kinase KdpD